MYCFQSVKNTLQSFGCQQDSNLISIGTYAFYQCIKLETVDLSSCSLLRSINASAFYQCTSLSNVVLPEGLQVINSNGFRDTAITSINIPASVLILEDSVFRGCSKMSSITFTPKSKLKKLSNNAFSSCPLTTFTIPAEVNSFVGSVFGSIKSIESIIVDKENQNFVGDELNRYVLNSQKTALIYFASAITGDFSVPDGVTLIEHAAFGGTNLDSIELPNSVTQISEYAFYSAKISSIRLPDTIKSIGQCAFYSTPYLKAIKLPSSLQTLETLLFADSGIVNITIPDSVTTIKDSAFAGCHQLQNVVLPKNLQTIGGNVFPSSHYVNFEFGGDSSIYINSQSLLMDKNNTYISLYLGSGQDTITIPSTVKTIKDSAFRWRSNIRSVTCSGESQLERIESYAFQNCINLNSFFNFPNIKYIGAYAFANTKFPNSLSFGSEFYKVEDGAFLNCSFIPSVSFSSSVLAPSQVL